MPRSEFSRTCSECGASLRGRAASAKTCSDVCRAGRSRRIKRSREKNLELAQLPAHQKDLQAAITGEVPEVAHEVIQQELRPIVREALTEDVLRSIDNLIGLTPAAIRALEGDLASDDSKVRQRAYELVLRYTVGNQPIVNTDSQSERELIVNFNLPRPEGEAQEDEITESTAVRVCLVCDTEKPEHEFVAGSDRCTECHEKLQDKVKSILGDDQLQLSADSGTHPVPSVE